MQSLKNTSELTFFNVCNNYIKNEVADDIATVLSRNPELHYLNLSQNDLQTVGTVKIVKALDSVLSLKIFVVSCNKLIRMILQLFCPKCKTEVCTP